MAGRHKAHFGVDGTKLFDLEADPGERHDLHEEQSQILQRLRNLSDAELRKAEQRVYRMERLLAPAPLTDDERERLQALGYLDVP